ncbi:glycosyltransferase, partial [Candidatus Saccharibacteria bacterium]|nr:glycosyltransferase [Candidatus Saccharibacteria bacterium]NIW78356.1 glycosyltransferase [Calditrichia bacterium]
TGIASIFLLWEIATLIVTGSENNSLSLIRLAEQFFNEIDNDGGISFTVSFFEILLYHSIFLFLTTVVLAISNHVKPLAENNRYLHLCLSLNGVAILIAWSFTGEPVMCFFPFAIAIIAWISCSRLLRNFNPVGQAYLIAAGMLLLSSFSWGIWFVTSLDISIPTRLLLYAAMIFSIFTFPHLIGNSIIMAAIIGRNKHSRPSPPPQEISKDRKYFPKVSLHVPCYAEPPEVVIKTINALNNLDYPNLEVLVIDNNTQDPLLWKPVEAYCASLGEKIRFFHVAPLKGAKAGALNWVLPHVAPDTEIIGCIDADYVVEPDFLMRLVGHFDDPMLGFVQTSHDYRSWKTSLYQKMCYWEYMPTYKQNLPALSEWTAGYTVGTMCLIRRKALVEAGGWAEWCLTEDSELAIRIHALGYNSICLPDTFGRGLIPDTFAGYKKQRFRWTVGPLQQFKHHFRLFLPRPFGKPSAMSFAQKYFEFIHCTETASNLYQLFMFLLGSAICFSMIFHGESINP